MRRWIGVLGLLALCLLTACGGRGEVPSGEAVPETGAAEPPAAEVRLSDYTQPPELRLSSGAGAVSAVLTAYSWLQQNPDGTLTGVDACGVHPLQLAEWEEDPGMTPLPVPAGAEVRLELPLTSEKITLRCWPEETARALAEEPGLFADCVEQGVELTVAEGRFTPPGEEDYIYEAAIKWNGGSGTGGTAYYGFRTTAEP